MNHGLKKALLTVGLIVVLFLISWLITSNAVLAGIIAILGTVILK